MVWASLPRCPDTRVDGICGRTKYLLNPDILSLAGSLDKPTRIVFPQSGCYHPSVATIAGGYLCLTVTERREYCGF